MTNWKIDASHTNVGFTVKHMMVAKVRGRFPLLEGTIYGDPKDLANATIEIKIDVASVHTNNNDRDAHLRSADFFDVENHPYMTFTSSKIVRIDHDEFKIHGNLTIKDITKEVILYAEYEGTGVNPWGVDIVAFEAKTKISRKDFELNWNQVLEAGGVLVGDEIKITIDMQANPEQ